MYHFLQSFQRLGIDTATVWLSDQIRITQRFIRYNHIRKQIQEVFVAILGEINIPCFMFSPAELPNYMITKIFFGATFMFFCRHQQPLTHHTVILESWKVGFLFKWHPTKIDLCRKYRACKILSLGKIKEMGCTGWRIMARNRTTPRGYATNYFSESKKGLIVYHNFAIRRIIGKSISYICPSSILER